MARLSAALVGLLVLASGASVAVAQHPIAVTQEPIVIARQGSFAPPPAKPNQGLPAAIAALLAGHHH